jgi:hypothetical protein
MQSAWITLLSRLASSETVIGADEAREWGHSEWQQVLKLGLLREMTAATALLCQECEEHCWCDVGWSADGRRSFLPCPRGYTIDVAPERLRRWLVDPDVLARLQAAALELTGPVEQRGTSVWSLGRRVLAGRFRDFLLALDDSNDGALQVAAGYAAPVVFVPDSYRAERVNGLPVFSLEDVSSLDAGRLILDLSYIEDALPRETTVEKTKKVRSISVPEDAIWQDVRIEVGELALRVSVRGVWHERSLEECGLSDGRKEDVAGDRGLQVLWLFARRRGRFNPRDIAQATEEKTPFKNQVSRLRRRLRDILAISGDPIPFEKSTGEYRCVFGVALESDRGFPTPAGVTWADFHFQELPGDRVRVGVRAKETFRARVRTSSSESTSTEVAEREALLQREYALDQLGLTNGAGLPSAEGQALLELLRSGGKMHRPPGDLAVMKLGARLKEWIGLPDEPLQYSEGRRGWITYFECSSAVG